MDIAYLMRQDIKPTSTVVSVARFSDGPGHSWPHTERVCVRERPGPSENQGVVSEDSPVLFPVPSDLTLIQQSRQQELSFMYDMFGILRGCLQDTGRAQLSF